MEATKILVVSDDISLTQFVGNAIFSALKMRFSDVVHICLPAAPLSFHPDVALLLCDVSATELGNFLEGIPCVRLNGDYIYENTEANIAGREFFVGVLGFPMLYALPPLEYPPSEKSEIPTMYMPWSEPQLCPATLDTDTALEVRRVAMEAHRKKGCNDVCSFTEFRLSDSGAITAVRTVMNPFVAPKYILGIAAEAVGIPFESLCWLLVRSAISHE